MLTYEKAISDLIEKLNEHYSYLTDQNQWAVSVALRAMVDIAKELDKEHEEKQHES